MLLCHFRFSNDNVTDDIDDVHVVDEEVETDTKNFSDSVASHVGPSFMEEAIKKFSDSFDGDAATNTKEDVMDDEKASTPDTEITIK